MADKDDELMMKLQTIVRNENKSQAEYKAAQQKYLAELKRMKIAKQKGECIDTSQALSLLEKSGIIDKNGHLNKRYQLENYGNE